MLALSFLIAMLAGPVAQPVRADDPLYLPDDMVQFFEARVDRRLPELQRLEGIIQTIFSKDGIGFSYSDVTRTAAGVFRTGSGNCLSFTQLVVAIGRYFNLNVRYREVYVAPTWSKHGPLVVLNQHVNALVSIGGRGYIVDLVPEINRIEIRGNVVGDERGMAHYFNNLGAEWLAAGNAEQAVVTFRRSTRVDPTAAFAWANLGVALAVLKRDDEAEEMYDRALELDRENLVAMSNLSELCLRHGRDKEAEELFKRVEDFRNRNPYYHYSLGLDSLHSDAPLSAVQHFKDALKRKKKEHRFYFGLAQAYAQLGEWDEAIKNLQKARKYAPDEAGRERYSQKLELLASYSSSQDPTPE
ncbi:MAG: tetratricopeptide repeat protein [Acidobacteriota bacterium]